MMQHYAKGRAVFERASQGWLPGLLPRLQQRTPLPRLVDSSQKYRNA